MWVLSSWKDRPVSYQ